MLSSPKGLECYSYFEQLVNNSNKKKRLSKPAHKNKHKKFTGPKSYPGKTAEKPKEKPKGKSTKPKNKGLHYWQKKYFTDQVQQIIDELQNGLLTSEEAIQHIKDSAVLINYIPFTIVLLDIVKLVYEGISRSKALSLVDEMMTDIQAQTTKKRKTFLSHRIQELLNSESKLNNSDSESELGDSEFSHSDSESEFSDSNSESKSKNSDSDSE
jgi:hypothetical protein